MKIKSIETFAVAFLLSVSLNTAQAQKAATDKAPAKKAAGKQTDRRADRPTRESIIKRFDKDGDGKLSDTERAAARKAISSRGGRTTDRAPGRISEGLRERYRIAAKKIQEDLKAGKITEEQARERQQALRKRLAQSAGRGGDRDTDRVPGRISEGLRERYQIAAKKIQEDLKAGKITEAQARERQQALRKRLAQSAGRGGDRDTDRSRSSRESLMKEFDKNKDGKLDEAERNALRKAMSERSRSRGGERGERGRRGGEAAERGGERRRRGGEGAERGRRGGDRSEGGERRRRGNRDRQ